MRMLLHTARHWILGLLVLATPCAAAGQGDPTRPLDQESALRAVETKLQLVQERVKMSAGEGSADALPGVPEQVLDDPATRDAYLTYVQERYRYLASHFEHRRDVFAWQHWSSQIIFGVVLVLVGTGVYFSAVQFHRGLRPTRHMPRTESGEKTEFSASLKEIKVSSPVLGVIILAISLAFFYLYLVFVYPIQEVV
jgi:hypothetical protein